MSKTKQFFTKYSLSNKFAKRMKKAKEDYEKLILELDPFIPRAEVKEITTEGKWQPTATISSY